jgi:2,5-diamino-6-(ribosylamino)-4(3H)-pyrimidinone 5'-phosphate reductase
MMLCSHATPQDYQEYLNRRGVPYILAGSDHVDLRAVLEELSTRFGVKSVRVDSDGILNGALLRAGLVDEVSMLIDPCIVGGTSPCTSFVAPDLTTPEGVTRLPGPL